MTIQAAPKVPGPATRREPPLHIAMVSPPWFETPPEGYGGIETVVAALVDQLVDQGHQVTLIGAGVNGTKATGYVPAYDRAPSERLGESIPEVVQAAVAAAAIADLDVDLVHDHTLAGPLLARGREVPTLMTMHGPVTGELGRYVAHLGATVGVVAISDAQRRLAPRLNWVATVHNAIDVASFPFRDSKDPFVLWLGRFNAEKGPELAIAAARAAGRRIILAGKRNEPGEQLYFDQIVRPLLGADAEYVGEADSTLKRTLLAGAECLLFPIQWEEPFGMVMVEAMACGTPVVALRRGSVPEVVSHGVTGVIVDDVGDLPGAVVAARALDPAACRAHVQRHFDLPVLGSSYELVYRTLLAGGAGSDAPWPTVTQRAADTVLAQRAGDSR